MGCQYLDGATCMELRVSWGFWCRVDSVMCVAKTARIMYAPDGLDEPSSLFRMVEAPPLTQFPLSHTYQSSTQALLVSKLGLSW